jgi:1-acyl-sn-glycerol-3-phosphate acyltransferase
MLARLVGAAIIGFAKAVTGVQALWIGCAPVRTQRIYFSNHTSHGDFALIWAALPPRIRRETRPVAAADYWGRGGLKNWLIDRVFRGVLVERSRGERTRDPIDAMAEALARGDSLILFPEGTRNSGPEMLPFKSGLYHLARRSPETELVPAWIENIGRVLPKGELFPVPLLCAIRFGAPLRLEAGEDKEVFLARARAAVLALRP